MVDAEAVLDAGVDAMGLNFSPRSARCVGIEDAASLARAVADEVCVVGVFLDQTAEEVRRVLSEVPLDALQFHGDEPNDFCASFGVPFMKAYRVREPLTISALEAAYPDAAWHLLDAYVPGAHGGTGEVFDWQYWPEAGDSNLKLGLAGGLTPANVAGAMRQLHPAAVDVAGGVEGALKGKKEPDRIRAFAAAVRAEDAARKKAESR